MKRPESFVLTCLLLSSASAADLAPVISKPVSRTVELPGEIMPFLSVSLHAKVPGYVERVTVDRGSVVKQGDLLVELNAPEITARIVEAESRAQAAQSDRAEAEAQRAGEKILCEPRRPCEGRPVARRA